MSNETINVTLDDDTAEFLAKLARSTGASQSEIIVKMLGSKMTELAEYMQWLDGKVESSSLHSDGVNLLLSYGPEDLLEGIRRLDPAHVFASEAFNYQLDSMTFESRSAN